MHRFHVLLPIFLLIGAFAALAVLAFRHRAEARNRAVELTVEYAQVAHLSAVARVPVEQALRDLKAAGVTSVALSEETLADLVSAGAAEVRQERVSGLPGLMTVVRFADAATFDRVDAHLTGRLRLPAGGERGGESRAASPAGRVMLQAPGRYAAIYPIPWTSLRGLEIGLSGEETAGVHSVGLGIVGRTSNFTGAGAESISWVLGRLKEDGARVVVFTGEEVLGHRARLKETAAALDALGLVYGSVEMGKQRGDLELSKALESRIVRVHAVQPAELARLSPAMAVERYVRAVRERNIRVAYLRLFTSVVEGPLAYNVAFVRGVADELRERGYVPGPARPFEPVLADLGLLTRLLPALVALLVVGGGLMLLATLAPIPPRQQLLPALLLGLLAMGLAFAGPAIGRKLLALAAAILFPTLAFTLWPLSARAREGEISPSSSRSLAPSLLALSRFAYISGVSLLGGLAVAGLLSDRAALVKVSEFSGIKAAQALPLLLLAAILGGDLWRRAPTWEAHRQAVSARVAGFLGEPLRLWHALAAGCALVALALLLLRSGNDPGVGVSSLELRFRSLLDQVLVRPRTKEFLIGHPALVTALFLWATGRARSLVAPLLLLGVVGQAGMVNSFCHLHTPIALTLARTGNGLWLGALLGLAIVALVTRSRRETDSPAASLETPAPLETRRKTLERLSPCLSPCLGASSEHSERVVN